MTCPGLTPHPDRAPVLAQTRREQSCRCEELLQRHGNGSIQSGDQFAAGFELDRGAREVVADRFAATAKMRREERFDDGFEGAAIFGPAEAVTFVRIIEIGHGDAVLLHRRDDLLGLRGFDAYVVGALADQQRPHDTVDAIERRTPLQEPHPASVV